MSVVIGIIAEDDSDIDVFSELLAKIAKPASFSVKKHTGDGCGKIFSKCVSWIEDLKRRGCSHFILVQDSDRSDPQALRRKLEGKIKPDQTKLVLIPTIELEAWLLSDPDAIKAGLNLDSKPQTPAKPEESDDPKRDLKHIIKKYSNNKKFYVNTCHNKLIAKEINLEKVKKCKSFLPFLAFTNSIIPKSSLIKPALANKSKSSSREK